MEIGNIGGSLIEVTLSGAVYKFAPIDIGDLADFEAWAAAERGRRAVSALGAEATPAERMEIVKWSLGEYLDIGREMSTMSGVRQLLYFSLRKHQPEITIAEISALVNIGNLGEMQTLIDALSGVQADAVEDNGGPPVVKPHRGRRSSSA